MAAKKRKLKRGCLAVIIIFVILAGGAFGLNYYLNSGLKNLVPDRDVADGVTYRSDRINVLVVGTDKGADSPNDTGRADSIMVFNVDLKNNKVNAVSIPRDSRVSIPGKKNKTKINHSFAYGGIDLTKETVSDLLGIPIDYYAVTNFAGFEKIVDTLGGIEIDVPIRMKTHTYYNDIDLQPGLQTLTGDQAIGFVRYRYDAGGDVARAGRQQQFLKAVFTKMVSGENLLKLPQVVPEVLKNVETDFTTAQLVALAKKFKDIDLDADLYTEVLAGKSKTISGGSYWLIDEPAMKETIQKLFIDDIVASEDANTEPSTEKDTKK